MNITPHYILVNGITMGVQANLDDAVDAAETLARQGTPGTIEVWANSARIKAIRDDKVCPGCHISLPVEALTDLRTNLCRMCVAEHERRNING
jgi:hypothetical protein